ncbi:MAG TPA: 3-oxoacyl-ACP reductase family protein [Polyangiaceae bacterium]|nr:3-oxoacyl-ACP reductase family protein [Polyangiaceae bacterium]
MTATLGSLNRELDHTPSSPRKVALVTGASRGIGRAIARGLAQRGCHVVINYAQNQAAAQAVHEELNRAGYACSIARSDVSNWDAVQDLMRSIRGELGRLDILVNNAGVLEEKLFFFQSLERFWEVMRINLGGTANLCKAATPLLGARKAGRIVNLSSIAASHGTTGLSAYACSKAGIEALTKVLARELASSGIRVNAVAPGLIQTEMTESLRSASTKPEALRRQPVERLGRPEEVAELVSFLALDAPDYFTGEVLRLDGGAAIA